MGFHFREKHRVCLLVVEVGVGFLKEFWQVRGVMHCNRTFTTSCNRHKERNSLLVLRHDEHVLIGVVSQTHRFAPRCLQKCCKDATFAKCKFKKGAKALDVAVIFVAVAFTAEKLEDWAAAVLAAWAANESSHVSRFKALGFESHRLTRII